MEIDVLDIFSSLTFMLLLTLLRMARMVGVMRMVRMARMVGVMRMVRMVRMVRILREKK